MALTFSQLADKLQQFAEDYEQSFIDNIPTFIQAAEKRIYNAVQPPVTKAYSTGTTGVTGYVSKPGDFLSPLYLRLTISGRETFMLNKDVSYLKEAYPTSTTGVPKVYAEYDSTNLILAPTPSSSYAYELSYFRYPESITTTSDGTSWLGNNYEHALLYGSLREAAVYKKEEPDTIQNYNNLFQQALGDVLMLGAGKNRRDVYRSRQQRLKDEDRA